MAESAAAKAAKEAREATEKADQAKADAAAKADQNRADAAVGESGPVPGSGAGEGAETINDMRDQGVVTAGEVQAAGNPEAVTGDPDVHVAYPGAPDGLEAVGSGHPVPPDARAAMEARAAAGIPEPPKIGPVHNTDLYDTPGGYQIVPAGMTPQDVEDARDTRK